MPTSAIEHTGAMSLATFLGSDSPCQLTRIVGTHAFARHENVPGRPGHASAGVEGRLIDQPNRYDWIDHLKIRHVGELHEVD